jgi:UDP-N-acetylmuramoyl-L-alanyl-D-glutamate--2,6-diaminopimelate ligase
MAEVAVTKGDKLVLTSDNPRSENPETILDEMQHGIPAEHFKKMLRITDRKEAIRAAVSMASSGDIILLAGKGHETYQDIMGTKFHFDDKEVIAEMFKTLEK